MTASCHNVMLFSDASFNEYLESIQADIGCDYMNLNLKGRKNW